jgi:anion-transporting  ArsA/GET3 family ATPase
MSTRILICCGSGGVGKTTCSAALGLELARRGHRVGALTIDPSQRLADALGISISGTPQPVEVEGGSLDAMVLDVKQTFDGVVHRFAPDEGVRDRILANRYYEFVSTRLAGAHEYMAMERLYQLYGEGTYDVLILDTPPTRNAMEFLDAPKRMAGLMDEGVMGRLSAAGGGLGIRVLTRGSLTALNALSRLVGMRTVREITEFFTLFRDLWQGFRQRSLEVDRLLHSDQTRFLLVATPAPAARAEARDFLELLWKEGLPFGGAILNRVTPIPTDPAPIAPDRFPPCPDEFEPPEWQRITEAIAQAPVRAARRASYETQAVTSIGERVQGAPCWHVPLQPEEVRDIEGLSALGAFLSDAAEHLVPT